MSNGVLRALTEFEPEGMRIGDVRPGASRGACICVVLCTFPQKREL